jgi:hypothetical protein
MQLGHNLLDRSPRSRLNNNKIQHHNPEQRRDNKQKAADKVSEHKKLSKEHGIKV